MSNLNDKVECVGTLLVHSSDLQGLSGETRRNEEVECVGSLLVHSSDVKELSSDRTPVVLPQVNLRSRVTVGTLLVASNDLRSPEEDKMRDKAISIQRRYTDRMTGPAPGDDESDSWAD
jgi:hypothetical protein